MKTILFTVLAGLLLLWAGVGALLKWIRPIEQKHILWLGGYASLVTGLLLFLVINTSMTQQKEAREGTATLVSAQMDDFRKKIGEYTERLMGQLEEKAELTESEMEVRGNLRQERSEHALSRERLAQTEQEVQAVAALRDKEQEAHFAYRDSLNTERAQHTDTRGRLQSEEQGHESTMNALGDTRRSLGKSEERAKSLANDVKRLRTSVKKAESRAEKAENNEKKLLTGLKGQDAQLGQHTESLIRLQAMVDSLYFKRFKRLYTAPGETPMTPGN
jgi:chromosome segregation ATPase